MGKRRKAMNTEPLSQFADQIEFEMQQLDQELLQEKACRWEKKLGDEIAKLKHDPVRLISCLLSEDWERREVAIQMLAIFYWSGVVPGLVHYVARHDPHEYVRCAAIEEIGDRLIRTKDSSLRASISEIIVNSTCKDTALRAYSQLVASLSFTLEEMRAILNLTYETIDWELVRKHREIQPAQE